MISIDIGPALYSSLDSTQGAIKIESQLDQRVRYLRQYGSHSLSFTAFQPGIQLFTVPEIGWIAFEQKWGQTVVLGDPVCDPAYFRHVLAEFLEMFPDALFIQVSAEVAQCLQVFGYYTTRMGKESVVDLGSWSLTGKRKQVIRTACNKVEKDGIRIVERNADPVAERELTRSWLSSRKCRDREIRFLIRPMHVDFERGVRRFFAYDGDTPIGFVFFDPVYRNNRVIGYIPNISRASLNFHQGIFYALMNAAMTQFKSEGVSELHLGLMPLKLERDSIAYESEALRKMLMLTKVWGKRFYNFDGINFTKSRFCGTEHDTFVGHRHPVPLLGFATMFRLCNIL